MKSSKLIEIWGRCFIQPDEVLYTYRDMGTVLIQPDEVL